MELSFCNIETRYINGAKRFRLSYLSERGDGENIYALSRESLEKKAYREGLKLEETNQE